MIKNELQYRVTRSQAEKFEKALEELSNKDNRKRAKGRLLAKAFEDSLRSQLDELREDIREYEELRQGPSRPLELRSLDDLPQVLIRARIAAGLTQKELANLLNLKEQQIQRYETTEYASASTSRLREVANALGLVMKQRAILESSIRKPAKAYSLKSRTLKRRSVAKKKSAPRRIAAKRRAR